MVCFVRARIIPAIIDGEIEGIAITPEFLVLFSIIFLVALVMPFLTLILKDSTNRLTNIIIGIIFTVLDTLELKDIVAKQSTYAILHSIAGIVITALIVWYAYKWSKQET